jgi:hypothetical protein
MHPFQSAVYLLCALTSATAMLLLLRSYAQGRSRLLLWSGLAFIALACNNMLLFVDVVVLPDVDLLPLRHAAALIGVGLMLYALLWEVD